MGPRDASASKNGFIHSLDKPRNISIVLHLHDKDCINYQALSIISYNQTRSAKELWFPTWMKVLISLLPYSWPAKLYKTMSGLQTCPFIVFFFTESKHILQNCKIHILFTRPLYTGVESTSGNSVHLFICLSVRHNFVFFSLFRL